MSDVVPYHKECKIRDEKIIDGYLRGLELRQMGTNLPKDIINLLLKYYHYVTDSFNHYNPDFYSLSNENMIATKIVRFGEVTIYGSISIPSCALTKHQWKFKIHKAHYGNSIAIGIDETKHIRKD